MEDISNYEKIKEDANSYYFKIGKKFCPALNEYIHFNAEGFNHIVFKNSHSERERTSQILRFKLLHLAVKLTELTTTCQEFEETLKEFEIKKYKKKIREVRPVKYWGIIAIIDDRKIKVVFRKRGENGQLHFWSIVPAWVTNKYRDMKLYSTMKGNPEED